MDQFVDVLIKAGMPPPHPGEFFALNFLGPKKLSLEHVSENMDMSIEDIQRFISGADRVDDRLARRLSDFTETSPELWVNLQAMKDFADSK